MILTVTLVGAITASCLLHEPLDMTWEQGSYQLEVCEEHVRLVLDTFSLSATHLTSVVVLPLPPLPPELIFRSGFE